MNKPRLPFDIEFLMESVLKETPDFIMGVNDKSLAQWDEGYGKIYAFMTFDHSSVLGKDLTHYKIAKFMDAAINKMSPETYLNNLTNLSVSNIAGLKKDLIYGRLGKAAAQSSLADDTFRVNFGLSGRIWVNKKMISFWNSRQAVIKDWDALEQMFKDFAHILGPIEEYHIDWIERRCWTPLTPASTLSGNKRGPADGEQQLALRFADDLSGDEIKAIQKRLHTMKPEEKKKALQALGKKNVKAAEIADALGMSVAQFNHIMHVNETEEEKMPTLAELAVRLGKRE